MRLEFLRSKPVIIDTLYVVDTKIRCICLYVILSNKLILNLHNRKQIRCQQW